ncbi:MAG: polyprenyl synthetase family protein [Planctomycetota bacterium]
MTDVTMQQPPSRAPEASARLRAPANEVERFMRSYLDRLSLPSNLDEAIRYALLGGGKRLRPILVAHGCAAVGGDGEACMPAAAAVEMIHAFSLVHDDLPALDDDDLRRGRPTVHVKFGEAMAILVGDGLMSLAFQVISDSCTDPVRTGRLLHELAVGTTDMIAGQVHDTLGGWPASMTDEQRLREVHRKKTGALLRASCRMGGLSAGLQPGDDLLARLTTYGEAIGLMFQIVDDILDVEQTAEHTGKRTSKDEEAGKLTYPGVLGLEQSRSEIGRLEAVAMEAIAPMGDAASALRELCEYLTVRTR